MVGTDTDVAGRKPLARGFPLRVRGQPRVQEPGAGNARILLAVRTPTRACARAREDSIA